MVLIAVKNNGFALEHVSDNLKDNKEVVLATINDNSYALQFASDRLKNDKHVVLKAVGKTDFGRSYEYCGKLMQRDPDVIELANKNMFEKKILLLIVCARN